MRIPTTTDILSVLATFLIRKFTHLTVKTYRWTASRILRYFTVLNFKRTRLTMRITTSIVMFTRKTSEQVKYPILLNTVVNEKHSERKKSSADFVLSLLCRSESVSGTVNYLFFFFGFFSPPLSAPAKTVSRERRWYLAIYYNSVPTRGLLSRRERRVVKTAFAGLVRKQYSESQKKKIYDRPAQTAEIDIEWEGRAAQNACCSPANRFLYNNNRITVIIPYAAGSVGTQNGTETPFYY